MIKPQFHQWLKVKYVKPASIVGKVNNVGHQFAAPIGAPLSFAWMLVYK
jgi:hypothetical protein